jgi:hypothetical protein
MAKGIHHSPWEKAFERLASAIAGAWGPIWLLMHTSNPTGN